MFSREHKETEKKADEALKLAGDSNEAYEDEDGHEEARAKTFITFQVSPA